MEPNQQPLMNEGIIEALTCPICCIKYDNTQRGAVVLPCGHTFCSLCIKTSQKKCPKCRVDFLDSQVTKNYIVHTLLDEMSHLLANNSQRKIIQKEICPTHKREIDRFCKGCIQLMCSVCHCPHFGSARDIISDVNFRDEIESLLGSYKDVGKTKQDFDQRINDAVASKIQTAEKNKTARTEEINTDSRIEIQKIVTQKDKIIKEAEEDAKQKIQLIEFNKLKIIKQADETARTKIKEIESKAATLVEEINSQNKVVFDATWKASKELKQAIDALHDLNKFNKDSLAECVTIYRLESQQRPQLQEFLELSKSDIYSLLKPNQYKQNFPPKKILFFNNKLRMEERELIAQENQRKSGHFPGRGRGHGMRGVWGRGGRGMRGMFGMRGRGGFGRGGYQGEQINENNDDNVFEGGYGSNDDYNEDDY